MGGEREVESWNWNLFNGGICGDRGDSGDRIDGGDYNVFLGGFFVTIGFLCGGSFDGYNQEKRGRRGGVTSQGNKAVRYENQIYSIPLSQFPINPTTTTPNKLQPTQQHPPTINIHKPHIPTPNIMFHLAQAAIIDTGLRGQSYGGLHIPVSRGRREGGRSWCARYCSFFGRAAEGECGDGVLGVFWGKGGLVGEGEVQAVGCSYTLVQDEEAPDCGGACVSAEVNIRVLFRSTAIRGRHR